MDTETLFDLKGKTALVTGGSRGIGLMIAQGYVERGVKVYISSRKVDVCDAVAAELSELGECVALPTDISTPEGCQTLADALSEREDKLDILV
ncbi:MAG: SDR family NAD(P)-dependent oxidoreductase, partial [Candidatus Hydrogenedentota bacterium]